MQLFVARFRSSGHLDQKFGTGGVAMTGFGAHFPPSAMALVVEPDDITVIAGGDELVVARYRSNGAPDLEFGHRGLVVSPFFAERDGFIIAIAIDHNPQTIAPVSIGPLSPGGRRIVAVGTVDVFLNSEPDPPDFLLARYDFNGNLDPAFGAGGKVSSKFGSKGSFPQSAAVDSERCVVAAGGINTEDDGLQFIVARYLPNGDQDAPFGENGVVIKPASSRSLAEAVTIAAGRKVLAAGTMKTSPGIFSSSGDFLLVRHLPDGDLDSAFGGDGRVLTTFDEGFADCHAVAVDRQNRAVAAGEVATETVPPRFALARYRSFEGLPDSGFGDVGRMTVGFENLTSRILHLAIAADDSVIAVGESGSQVAIARVREDGTLDTSFNVDGKLRMQITPGQPSKALAAAIDDSQRLIVAGVTWDEFETETRTRLRFASEAGDNYRP